MKLSPVVGVVVAAVVVMVAAGVVPVEQTVLQTSSEVTSSMVQLIPLPATTDLVRILVPSPQAGLHPLQTVQAVSVCLQLAEKNNNVNLCQQMFPNCEGKWLLLRQTLFFAVEMTAPSWHHYIKQQISVLGSTLFLCPDFDHFLFVHSFESILAQD